MKPKAAKIVAVFRHAPREHLGAWAPLLKETGLPAENFDLWKGPSVLPRPESLRALIIMGGPMGVYEQDKHPFIKKEIKFIREIIRRKRPVLGVCLGGQMIAAALGAKVYPHVIKEIGWRRVELTEAGRRDPLFSSFPPRPPVFQWHGDTFDLPEGSELLAAAPDCARQAFRFGKNVHALQFHLEMDRALLESWLLSAGGRREIRRAGLGSAEDILAEAPRWLPGLRKNAARFFQAFADQIRF